MKGSHCEALHWDGIDQARDDHNGDDGRVQPDMYFHMAISVHAPPAKSNIPFKANGLEPIFDMLPCAGCVLEPTRPAHTDSARIVAS